MALKEAEQLLAAVGINASSMLAAYTPLNPPSKLLNKRTSVHCPQTLHELMLLYANMPLTLQVEDQVKMCEMAIAADDVDKTMAMYIFQTNFILHVFFTDDCSIALPNSTDDSLVIVQSNIVQSMISSLPVQYLFL